MKTWEVMLQFCKWTMSVWSLIYLNLQVPGLEVS